MTNSRIGFRVVVMSAALVDVWLTSAQTFRGCITGMVTDESKAVVAGAKCHIDQRRLCLSTYAGLRS